MIPLRWLKGLWWEPEQYLDWPPLLAEAGYNGLLLCYTFCPETSLHWRRPFRSAEAAVIRRLASDCAGRGLTLGVAINPCIGGQAWRPEAAALPFHPLSGRGWFQRYWTARRAGGESPHEPDPPLRYDRPGDRRALIEKFLEARRLGARAFALCLDDIEPGTAPTGFRSLAEAQRHLATEAHAVLESSRDRGRLADAAGPQLLIAPTYYWTAGLRRRPEYARDLTDGLPSDVVIFWTGEEVRSHAIPGAAAREAGAWLGRRPVLWYNYASNDSFRFALQLPPAPPPAADLAGEVAGVLVNPMRQARLTRLHALVMAAWLRDPDRFDPAEALDRAIRRLVGDGAAPWLHEYVAAWAAYPDPRTLPADLEERGLRYLIRLEVGLRNAARRIEIALPRLDAALADRVLVAELRGGARRLRFLAEALGLRRAEAERGGEAIAAARARLCRRLAEADPEAACDAQAVLS